MSMKLHELQVTEGSQKPKHRKGRGHAAGKGKQAGKGQSGQNKRNRGRAGFEGGQNPWFRRLPKRGFNNVNHVEYQIVTLEDLNMFKDGETVTIPMLFEAKIIRDNNMPVKLLANGSISKKITVQVNATSATAKEALEQAGGKVEVVSA